MTFERRKGRTWVEKEERKEDRRSQNGYKLAAEGDDISGVVRSFDDPLIRVGEI